jgi:Nitrile hydratase, alpha chain
MSEASGGSGRAEWERRLINRSMEDEHFRQRFLEDPKGTLEQELGRELPEGVEVRAVEESADTIYLVLPSASRGAEVGELSDRELQQVAGGWGEPSAVADCTYMGTCDDNCWTVNLDRNRTVDPCGSAPCGRP